MQTKIREHHVLIQEFYRFLSVARQLHDHFTKKDPTLDFLPRLAAHIAELETLLPEVEAAQEDAEPYFDVEAARFLATCQKCLDAVPDAIKHREPQG